MLIKSIATSSYSAPIVISGIKSVDEVAYSVGEDHYVLRPKNPQNRLLVAKVVVANNRSARSTMLVDERAAYFSDDKRSNFLLVDPYEAREAVSSSSENENRYIPFLWGNIDLKENYHTLNVCYSNDIELNLFEKIRHKMGIKPNKGEKWSLTQEFLLFYSNSNKKTVVVDQKRKRMEIVCCERRNCLYNEKNLMLTKDNILDLKGVRRILTERNEEEVDAWKMKLAKKKQKKQNKAMEEIVANWKSVAGLSTRK